MNSIKPYVITYGICVDGDSYCYTRSFDEFGSLLTFMYLELGKNACIEFLRIEKCSELVDFKENCYE